jgi:hypothetical protein
MEFRSKNLEEKIRQMHPLTIMGMHRSGTSLTVRLLKDIGIHMGYRLSRDAEAITFQKINRRIYNSVGSKWGTIDSLLDAMSSQTFIDKQTNLVLGSLFPKSSFLNLNTGIADFFGPQLWESLSQGDRISWGWKDPRTTLTFPIWLLVFPKTRFLHIIRNGIDVAISIHRRSEKQHQKLWKRIFPLDYSPATLDFQYCFQLWERYTSFVLDNKGIIPPGQYLELRFEELLAKPEEKLREISDFMEFPVRGDTLKTICGQINQNRLDNKANAWLYQDKIPSLASSPLMQRLGYYYEINV